MCGEQHHQAHADKKIRVDNSVCNDTGCDHWFVVLTHHHSDTTYLNILCHYLEL